MPWLVLKHEFRDALRPFRFKSQDSVSPESAWISLVLLITDYQKIIQFMLFNFLFNMSLKPVPGCTNKTNNHCHKNPIRGYFSSHDLINPNWKNMSNGFRARKQTKDVFSSTSMCCQPIIEQRNKEDLLWLWAHMPAAVCIDKPKHLLKQLKCFNAMYPLCTHLNILYSV